MANNYRPDNKLIGTAGMYYTAYILTRRGMVVVPKDDDLRRTGLVVSSRDRRRCVQIQVKTSFNFATGFWPICPAKRFLEGDEVYDYYALIRPRRTDHTGLDEMAEFEGFMLTAEEAQKEMKAHFDYKTTEGRELKFAVSVFVDKRNREQAWPEVGQGKWEKNRELWRKRWQTWTLN